MKRFLIFANLFIFGLSLGYAQSGRIIDDIYVTPNDAQMVQEVKSASKAKTKKQKPAQSAVYRNGAREIVFIDQNGNRTTAVSDTVYIVDGELIADSLEADSLSLDEGYYLNGFSGSKSDLEYAERIRRFHNPRYTITIADPGYNDIYFLDDNYWNVYIEGMYATITPTWTNPLWFSYQNSPFSYNSWAWRNNWGYPYYSGWGGYYGWNGYNSWGSYYDPWYSGYYGWGGYYDPWYSGYYGWGYPYYGGYYGWGGYGWDYPYYGGYYGGGWNNSTNQTSRRNYAGGRTAIDTNTSSRRNSVINPASGSGRSGYTSVSREPSVAGSQRTATVSPRTTRSTYSPDVNTRMRTGSVRTSQEWSNVRSNNTRVYTEPSSGERSSSVINRTNPTTRSSSVNTNSGRTYESRSSSSAPSRSYDSSSGSSNSTYTPSRSSDSGSSRSSSSYSSGSSSSGSYSSGSSSSGGGSRSSGGGGRR